GRCDKRPDSGHTKDLSINSRDFRISRSGASSGSGEEGFTPGFRTARAKDEARDDARLERTLITPRGPGVGVQSNAKSCRRDQAWQERVDHHFRRGGGGKEPPARGSPD